MFDLILLAFIAAVLWASALKWVRYLDTRDLLEGLRPTAAGVAAIEADLPKMPGDPR
jgi:hypothetical protein